MSVKSAAVHRRIDTHGQTDGQIVVSVAGTAADIQSAGLKCQRVCCSPPDGHRKAGDIKERRTLNGYFLREAVS